MSEINTLERFIGMLDKADVPSRYLDCKDIFLPLLLSLISSSYWLILSA